MWKEKLPGHSACLLIYMQNKLLARSAFSRIMKILRRWRWSEMSGSRSGAAGSVMAERLDGCPGFSAIDSVGYFLIWTLFEKKVEITLPTSCLVFDDSLLKSRLGLQEGKAGTSILQIKPRK